MTKAQRPFMAEIQKARRPGAPALPAPAPAPAPAPTVEAANNTEVMGAIHDLSARLDRFLAMDARQIDSIQVEISDISGKIKATKLEMAALRHPLQDEDKFEKATQELSAVVSATEVATNTIMACAEELEEIIGELKSTLPEGYPASRVNDMTDAVVRIYEACNFQDLTGQRITKVCRTLSFIEERIEAMMGVWSKREFEAMPLPPSVTKMDEDLELHGPTAGDDSTMISQADIDALFS